MYGEARLVWGKLKADSVQHWYLLTPPQQVSAMVLPSLTLLKHLLNQMAFPLLQV